MTGAARRLAEWLPFLAGWSLCLAGVWGFDYWVSVDGPSHVYNAFALRHYLDPDCSIYREVYLVNPFPVPNLTATAVLALLMLVAPPLLAEKLFLSAFIVLLPLALRYAIGAINPRERVVACLVFPLVMGLPLVAGWYGFAAGTVVAFLAIGYWMRQPHPLARPARRRLFGLFALLYLCHPFPLGAALVIVACVAAWQGWLEFRAGPRPAGAAAARLLAALAWRRAWPALRLAVPAAAMLGLFWVVSGLLGGPGRQAEPRSLAEIGRMILINESMAPLSAMELVLAPAFGAFLLLALALTLAWPGSREVRRPWYGLLLALGALAVLLLLFPERAMGGGNLARRLAVFMNLTLLLWLGAQRYGRAARAAIVVVALGVTGMQAWSRVPLLERVEAYHGAVRGMAAAIEGNSIVLPLNLDWSVVPDAALPPIFVRNTAGYLVVDRCFVDIGNYEGHLLYSALPFHPEINAIYAATPEALRERLDHVRPPDWVLMWGAAGRLPEGGERDARPYREVLEARYGPAARIGEGGLAAWLYRLPASAASPR